MSEYLIITSSGGGGHKIAAEALRECKKMKNSANKIHELDVMRSSCSFGSFIGKKCTDMWDNAQQVGDVDKQHHLVQLQPIAEAFFFLGTFFTVLHMLLTAQTLPKKVICTQPLHFLAITLAVKAANFFRFNEHRKITRVDLYLTDLPTDKAEHFLGSLRRLHWLSQSCFEMIRLHSPEPIAKDLPAKLEFWKNHAHLQPHQIKHQPLPLNPAFKEPHNLPLPGEATNLSLSLFTEQEREAMAMLELEQKEALSDTHQFNIKAEDKVGLIMLGSVPEKDALIQYVDSIIEASNKQHFDPDGPTYYFFVACGGGGQMNAEGEESLYSTICTKIAAAHYKNLAKRFVPLNKDPASPAPPHEHSIIEDTPKTPESDQENIFASCDTTEQNLLHYLSPKVKIIPFIGQPVAKIFARSDLSITRSGGMTSAEIMALKKREGDNKQILIHSPEKKIPEGNHKEVRQHLLKKIPLWENGNAQYLALNSNVNADIINPVLAKNVLQDFLAP